MSCDRDRTIIPCVLAWISFCYVQYKKRIDDKTFNKAVLWGLRKPYLTSEERGPNLFTILDQNISEIPCCCTYLHSLYKGHVITPSVSQIYMWGDLVQCTIPEYSEIRHCISQQSMTYFKVTPIFLGIQHIQRCLLSPFRDNGHLTRAQIGYNEKQTRTCQPIERAFGLLKGRWRRLKYIEMENVREVPSVISATCVLHNFCPIADEGSIEEFLDLDDGDDDDDDEFHFPVLSPAAVAKRNKIVIFLEHLR